MDIPVAYEAPTAELIHLTDETEEGWFLFVGFVYAVAVAYAAYCTSQGGSPDIGFSWRRGFWVRCTL